MVCHFFLYLPFSSFAFLHKSIQKPIHGAQARWMSMVRVWNRSGWDVWRRHLGKRSGRCRCQSPGPVRRVSGGRWPDWDEEGVSPPPPKEGILVWYPEQSENGVPAEGQPVVARCWNPVKVRSLFTWGRGGEEERRLSVGAEIKLGEEAIHWRQASWHRVPVRPRRGSACRARSIPEHCRYRRCMGRAEVQCRVGRCPHEVVGRVSHRRLFTHRKLDEIGQSY